MRCDPGLGHITGFIKPSHVLKGPIKNDATSLFLWSVALDELRESSNWDFTSNNLW